MRTRELAFGSSCAFAGRGNEHRKCVVAFAFRPAGLWPATAVLPWLKRQKPQPPPFTSAVSAVDYGEPTVPPSVMESVDGLPATDAEEGRQP